MRARIFLLTIAILSIYQLKAQQYAVQLIPDSLKTDAHAVKRMEEKVVMIKSPSKAVVRTKYAITILNEKGNDLADYVNSYTKLISLSDIGGKLFDASGKLLRSVKKKDIADMSISDDVSILTDVRIKRYSFDHHTYPYTVEFEDEQTYDGVYFLPQWTPIDEEYVSVEQSRFIVETPIDYQLRYKQFQYAGEPVVTTGKTKQMVWEVKNLMAVEIEPFQPAFGRTVPHVYISPTTFEIGNISGNMSSWKTLGQFIYQLNSGKDVLPDKVKSEVKAIAAAQATTTDKINAIYKYMQDRTRYVSVQLGIGSWQPFDAKYVADNKYGDCKALSNYMVSLLKEVNIKANYVLIRAGDDEQKSLMEDFPSPYFNHAVVCVPNGQDSIWLECTSQTVSPGFMGSFTGNRKALLISEEGGFIVSTPRYKAEDNAQLRRVDAILDDKGTLKASVKTVFTGEQQESAHSLIYDASPEQRKRYLNQVISLPTYQVLNSAYKEVRNSLPAVEELLEIEATDFTTTSGKRIFLQPNLFNRSASRLNTEKARKHPIELNMNYFDIDTVQIRIPEGYTVESLPKPVTIQNSFGDYSVKYEFTNGKLIMIRKHRRVPVVLPAESREEVVKYFDSVRKADNSRVVFVKKEG
jgi:transglutaminase-like putative cysteine protease